MDHQFVFTPDDVYRVILAAAGFIVSVTAAVKIITDIINRAKEPDKIQNDRITALESRVTNIENALTIYEKHQHRTAEAWVLYMQALSDVMDHMIYGNHVENLRSTREKMKQFITKYSMESDDY